jgi:threonine/homoserine/homoserine lactone efflux protein
VITTLTTIFLSSFVIALSGAMMPGPLLTITISESARKGFIVGPLIVLGHAVLELALVIALLFGLAPFFQKPSVFAIIAITGSFILLGMAWSMCRSLPRLRLSLESDRIRRNHPVVSGILMSIANPYWTIWWATIGIGYILYSRQFGPGGVAVFFIGHTLADLTWYSLIAAAVAKGKSFLSDRIYRGMIACLALLLVVFSFYFACAGIAKLYSII